jgi:hypothetical protein
MKVLRAMMLASVCALVTAGSTSARLLDVERTDTNVIIVETPPTAPITVTEASTLNVVPTPAAVTEMTPTTDVLPAEAGGVPAVTQSGGLPRIRR